MLIKNSGLAALISIRLNKSKPGIPGAFTKNHGQVDLEGTI